jgi:hypothetical protein
MLVAFLEPQKKDLFGKATGNEKKSKFRCIYASGEVDNRV